MCTIPEYSRATAVNYHNPDFRKTVKTMKERLTEADDSKEQESDSDEKSLVPLFGGGALDQLLLAQLNDFKDSIYKGHPYKELMYKFDLYAWDEADFSVLPEYFEKTFATDVYDVTDGIQERKMLFYFILFFLFYFYCFFFTIFLSFFHSTCLYTTRVLFFCTVFLYVSFCIVCFCMCRFVLCVFVDM